jgi:hypothetical protein
MMYTERKVSEVLRGAIRMIELHGWVQGRLQERVSMSVCTLGALQCSAYQDELGGLRPQPKDQRCEELRNQALHIVMYVLEISDVATWNDYPGRNRCEVLQALRAAHRVALHCERIGAMYPIYRDPVSAGKPVMTLNKSALSSATLASINEAPLSVVAMAKEAIDKAARLNEQTEEVA